MEITVSSLPELGPAAKQLLEYANDKKVFLFYGDLGAGKTTFIKAIAQELGVSENVSSPTFSIINEYKSPQGPVYHFDFYRLKNQYEALDIGTEDYFCSGNYCFIEWPDNIPNLLPRNCVKVQLNTKGPAERLISIK